MPGKFVMNKSGNGFHWNLLATNGKVIATSEHHETRRAALAGIASVQKNGPGASTVDADDQPAPRRRPSAPRARSQRRTAADRRTDAPPYGPGVKRLVLTLSRLCGDLSRGVRLRLVRGHRVRCTAPPADVLPQSRHDHGRCEPARC